MAKKKNKQFGPEFWDALRRIQTEFNTSSRRGGIRMANADRKTQWVPTEDIWDYREYDRHIDSPYNAGGSSATVANVDDIAESMKKSGQHHPGWLYFDPDYVDMPNEGFYGGHLAEGNHRVAAARQLKRPYYLVDVFQDKRIPNAEGGKPSGVFRGLTAKPHIRPNRHDYIPSQVRASDFEEFEGAMDAGDKTGSPDDRAIVKAMGNKSSAKRALSAMVKAGKVLGPAAGMVGLIAGMSDPLEALGATVDKAEGNEWSAKMLTKEDKARTKKYYADKQAAAERINPMAAYGKRGSKRKRS